MFIHTYYYLLSSCYSFFSHSFSHFLVQTIYFIFIYKNLVLFLMRMRLVDAAVQVICWRCCFRRYLTIRNQNIGSEDKMDQ